MADLGKLKLPDGTDFMPYTQEELVMMADGTTLSAKLDDLDDEIAQLNNKINGLETYSARGYANNVTVHRYGKLRHIVGINATLDGDSPLQLDDADKPTSMIRTIAFLNNNANHFIVTITTGGSVILSDYRYANFSASGNANFELFYISK